MKALLSYGLCLWWLLLAGSTFALEDPRLSITNAASDFVVSWPELAPGWVLEQAPHLQPPVLWVRVSSDLYQTNAASRLVRVSALDANRYFRLRKFSPTVAGLTGNWQLDEGIGPTSDDGSGLGEAMRFTNITWAAGRTGPGALHFNGGVLGGSASRAWVSNANYRTLPPSGRPFSVSLWLSPDAWTMGWRGVLGNDAKGTNGWHVALQTPGLGTNYLVFAATGQMSSLSVTGRTLLLPNQWHRLTVTHDGTQGSIYLDAELLASGAGNLLTHDGPIYFGGGFGGYDSFLGRIDDVRTYTNCLTQEEISLTGDWRFDEGAGGFGADSSIQGHSASVIDPMAWVPGRDRSGIDLSVGEAVIANDDYAVLPASGGSFSLSFWLRPGVLSDGWGGLMNCGIGISNGWQLAIFSQGLTQTLHFCSTNKGGTLDLSVPVNLTAGVWTKLDLTYNGGIATAYVNGRQVQSCNGAIQGSRAPLVVGAVSGMSAFNGVLDDLKIYCRERGEAEIGPVARTMWETVLMNSTTNIPLQGFGPAGRTLTYSVVPVVVPTNGTASLLPASSMATVQAGARKGPDAFAYTVCDGEFTSAPAIVSLSVVEPHWLSPNGGPAGTRDGHSPAQAWAAGSADALDAIWKTNNYYDCFFYAPGEYQTRGWKYLERGTANAGCKHIGSGSDQPNATTLKLVDIIQAFSEEKIFAPLHNLAVCDGFEVRDMVLNCNAMNLPKYARGEPHWIRIPLATTGRVDTVTLRWDNEYIFGNGYWLIGRASEFSLCAQRMGTNVYSTNCSSLISTGQVDVIAVGVEADALYLQFDRRAGDVDFYGLMEIEVSGVEASLPSAKVPGAGESRLDSAHSIVRAFDADPSTTWASGSESQVRIVIPMTAGSQIDRLNLSWNCQEIGGAGRLGPASEFVIQALDQITGQYQNVPFVRHGRATSGLETVTFGSLQSTNVLVTDHLALVLTAKEAGVDHYSIKEITPMLGLAPAPAWLPSSSPYLPWGFEYSVLKAFDQNAGTAWASGGQGSVTAITAFGNNLKFRGLKIVGFGTKAGRECFPMFLSPLWQGAPTCFGNILVEDCTFSQPATPNTDGLTVVAMTSVPPVCLTNAVIRHCTVSGTRGYFRYSVGMMAAQVENCVVNDSQRGVYFEPDAHAINDVGSVLIRSNLFVNVESGIYLLCLPASQFGSLTLLANEIVMVGGLGRGISSCDVCDPGPSGSIRNLTALNNIVRFQDWNPHPDYPDAGIYYADMRHFIAGNNLVAMGPSNALRVRQCPAGIIYPPTTNPDCDQPVPIPPGPPTYPSCLDELLPGYQRAWFNNRDLSGSMLEVRFINHGADGPASQQQWQE